MKSDYDFIVMDYEDMLKLKEAIKLKYEFVPKVIIDDGGKRAHYMEVIRFLYSNGYVIARIG